MSSMRVALKKIVPLLIKGLLHPSRIKPVVRKFMARNAYRIGNGCWAPLPLNIKIYVNARCNARCIMCDIGKREDTMFTQLCLTDGNDMTLELFNKIIADIRSFSPAVNLAGVEPLLHPNILLIAKCVKDAGLRLVITTNGLLLATYARELIDMQLDGIQVSLDGPESIHDRVRGVPGSYKAVIDGLVSLKQNIGISRETKIQINFCINEINYKYLAETYQFIISENLADNVAFIHPYFVTEAAAEEQMRHFPMLGTTTQTALTLDQLKNIDTRVLWDQLKRVDDISKGRGMYWKNRFFCYADLATYYKNPETPVSSKLCIEPWRTGMIFSNGDTAILNRCIPYITGNLAHEDFRTIWHGQRYKYFRKELKRSGGFPVCIRCCGGI